MLSVLSGIVLMLAIGTLIQRGDVVAEFLTGAPDPIVLNDDIVTVEADTLTRIDVLANDEEIEDGDGDRLVVVTQPGCGRVFVQNGALQYLGERGCGPEQAIVYSLADSPESLTARVEVTVRGATGARKPPLASEPAAPEAEAPALADATSSRNLEPPRVESSGMQDPAGAANRDLAALSPAAPSRGTESAPRIGAPAAPDVRMPGAAPRIATDSGLDLADTRSGGAGPGTRSPSQPSIAMPGTPRGVTSPSSPGAPAAPGGMDLAAVSPPGGLAPASPSAPRAVATPAPEASTPALANSDDPGTGLTPAASPATPRMRDPQVASDAGIGDAAETDDALARPSPDALGQGGIEATIALARVEVPSAAAAPSSARSQELQLPEDSAGVDIGAGMARSAPEIDENAGQAIAMLEPSSGLGEILSFGAPLTLTPIDTTEPEAPVAPSTPEEQRAAIDPQSGVLRSGSGAGLRTDGPEALSEPDKVAALPRVDMSCSVPPSITLDIRPAGETQLVVTSPCHAGSVALLSYEGIDLGIRLDRGGRGAVDVLGFDSSADAVLAFENGDTERFAIPFTGTDRMERVALTWDLPVALDLHALEFGARMGEAGHVSPASPGDFQDVRRRGGGYLKSFEPVDGVGQFVQIYTHWLRRGGQAGVVKLYIDFASRHRDKLPGTCGGGALSRPSFTVVRSSRGRIEAPVSRRLATVDCDAVDRMQGHLIEAAVRDIIISQR